ncbi:hypothetical protein IEQ34_008379 [Dendrobium chrysotoxum]|uniref:Uncharacterized protein n=1 Tax=Dendrobium chrysotoxum TaxID=161865 RepID=A0AAV7GZ82_DENCH|nr:hypothetical protein IEQ34_008379 [Dendrobium chrysotoxum]
MLKHSDIIFSSMKTIMTLVLEKTESISAQFLSCLFDGVKVFENNVLHTTKKVEKVLVNCSLKLKPYLAKLFNGNDALLSDYNKIVVAVFQGKPDTLIHNEMNASSTTKPDIMSYLCSRKGGRNASLQLSISNDHYGIGNKIKAWSNFDKKSFK